MAATNPSHELLALDGLAQDTSNALSQDAYRIARSNLVLAEQVERIADILDAVFEEDNTYAIRVRQVDRRD